MDHVLVNESLKRLHRHFASSPDDGGRGHRVRDGVEHELAQAGVEICGRGHDLLKFRVQASTCVAALRADA